ncbi:TPA: NAD(P)/FAD-dependent oxidoreductase [Pseudomonas aeruginosa]|nr:NAD(P)/FAD-dependent oxidoreductase [Pseudomonas aeruginosa]
MYTPANNHNRSLAMSTQPTPAAARHCKVAIIGTGFSGLGMAIRLRQEGEDDFLIFEKDAGVGGTWRVNNYPGCACDVQSHVYSFSFEANPEWTRMFARQPEIRAYLEKCWEKYRLQEKTLLNTEIGKLAWDERQSLWHLHDAQGNHYTANAVVSGMGGLSTPAYPRLDGLENFQGKVFHSQQWDHDYDLKGKRVAVIGTGASAIQFVPEIQPLVATLDLYQRTPPWILPKPDRAISETERRRFRRFPLVQKLWRGGLYSLLEGRVLGFTFAPQVMKLVQRLAIRHIHKQIKDPELRRKVTPDYTIGCKRILMSHNYYPALAAANSTVITEGIRAVTANGIVDGNGREREVDAIIFGTGFTANDPIPRGVVFGRDGRDLLDSWTKGPEAYKGTTTAGFPNLFFLMGPNTGLGHNSMVYMIESQIAYVLDALKLMKRRELLSLEVKAPVQERYNEYLQRKLDRSVWSVGGCKSWYLHPVSGRNCTLWPGFTWRFRALTRQFDASAYHLTTTPLAALSNEARQQAEGVPA